MPDRESDRLSGRVRRYARVGTQVGGIAARMAGQRYLGLPADRERNAAELKRALGGLKGPLMKVAQLLATVPGGLPDEYAEALGALQSQAPAMGWSFVKRRMAAELGPDWRAAFADFEPDAAAAASLGQVHRATGHNGTPLACKLQYPDMASAVAADIRAGNRSAGAVGGHGTTLALVGDHSQSFEVSLHGLPEGSTPVAGRDYNFPYD